VPAATAVFFPRDRRARREREARPCRDAVIRRSVDRLSRTLRALRASWRVDSVAANPVKQNNSISIATTAALRVRDFTAVEIIGSLRIYSRSGHLPVLENRSSSGE
jgi:hypothetical protein